MANLKLKGCQKNSPQSQKTYRRFGLTGRTIVENINETIQLDYSSDGKCSILNY